MTAVHNWQGFPTWISRLEEFVQNAQRLSEKVLQILCLTLLVLSKFYRLFLLKILECFSLNLSDVQLYSQTLYET